MKSIKAAPHCSKTMRSVLRQAREGYAYSSNVWLYNFGQSVKVLGLQIFSPLRRDDKVNLGESVAESYTLLSGESPLSHLRECSLSLWKNSDV